MSFAISQLLGSAQDLTQEATTQATTAVGHERETRVVTIVRGVLEELSKELGGYLAISAHGQINESEGLPGDSINIQLSSLLPPAAPVADTGAAAALGSTATFPPEASTAAPATEDNSPPASQEPIPQSADAVPDLSPAASAATPVAESDASLVPDGQTETSQESLDLAPESTPPAVTEPAAPSDPVAPAPEEQPQVPAPFVTFSGPTPLASDALTPSVVTAEETLPVAADEIEALPEDPILETPGAIDALEAINPDASGTV